MTTNYRFVFTKEKEKHGQSSVTLLKNIAKRNKTLKLNQTIPKR